MKWFTLIKNFYMRNESETQNVPYPQNILIEKLKVERKYRLLRKHIRYTKQSNVNNKRKSSLAFDPNGCIYSNLIVFYDIFYDKGEYFRIDKKVSKCLEEFEHFSKNQKQTYKKRLEELMQEYGKPITKNDDFILYIIKKMPSSVFNEEDALLWRKIYDFATTKKIEFRIIDRKSKCEKEIREQTYIEFANTFDISQNSCKGRFFVRLFCQQTTGNYTRVDDMLRYKANAEFFSKQDFASIGTDEQAFFDVIKTIKRISKK